MFHRQGDCCVIRYVGTISTRPRAVMSSADEDSPKPNPNMDEPAVGVTCHFLWRAARSIFAFDLFRGIIFNSLPSYDSFHFSVQLLCGHTKQSTTRTSSLFSEPHRLAQGLAISLCLLLASINVLTLSSLTARAPIGLL